MIRNSWFTLTAGTVLAAVSLAPAAARALTVTPTDPGDPAFRAALGGQGITITGVSHVAGVQAKDQNTRGSQFGTYTDFSQGPVTIGDGIVLSTGNVVDVRGLPPPDGPFANGVDEGEVFTDYDPIDRPGPDVSQTGTPAFDAYGSDLTDPSNAKSTRIENFDSSWDVASFRVDFAVGPDPTAVAFDFIFGSVEYPFYTSDFTDAFLVFLDGTLPENQIAFDANGNPVQVGVSFAGLVRIDDLNTIFTNVNDKLDDDILRDANGDIILNPDGSPRLHDDDHGLLALTTTTQTLQPGEHFLLFMLGDVNDPLLDSGVFITNFRAAVGGDDPVTGPPGGPPGGGGAVPEPSSLALLGAGALALLRRARRRPAS